MIKDVHLRIIFIPLLGVGLPLLSGLITYDLYSPAQLVVANLFFILTSFTIWSGNTWMHSKIRLWYAPSSNPFTKINIVCFVQTLYGACISIIAALTWSKFSEQPFSWNIIARFVVLCSLAVIVFTLIYEILFLSKERELDTHIVHQLDQERSQAELQALTNELDPHFIFNSLNTLNHLILNNPEQAYSFNNKLAQVYRYFLLNKTKEVISLKDEMEFINDYFYLLQIRHDHKLHLLSEILPEHHAIKIPPCALQILVENAIKHNEFSDTNPLKLTIAMNGHFLKVSNNTKPKSYSVHSTGIGLKNLRSRYRIICQKEIVIERTRENYTVKLPLIR